ncbi:MAG: SDR family NAD(P)-dependent oxidoreductase [Clostridia bacterium]|nr:SDR family NAD(P)-dependent oxidoreductase [Clostridia bacterium]
MKYVVVTGANGGMGRAVVEKLASSGYFVFALDRQLSEPFDNVLPLAVDVTDTASVQHAFDVVASHTDNLFAVVHFAGIYRMDSLVEMDEKSFAGIFDVNVFGCYRVNKAFLPLLKQGSKIVITSSELAPLDPLPFTGIYGITKSTVEKYAFSLRMELQLLGIKVVVLRPGAVKTNMLGDSTSQLDQFVSGTQLYSCNAARFKGIVDKVEARNVAPQRVANKTARILSKRRPRYVYKINRNPLLLLLNALPDRWQTGIIKMILK